MKKIPSSRYVHKAKVSLGVSIALLFVAIVLAAIAAIFFYRSTLKSGSFGIKVCAVINAI